MPSSMSMGRLRKDRSLSQKFKATFTPPSCLPLEARERLGWERKAIELETQAAELAERFESAFWCPEIDTYALALDGAKKPCRVRTSNAGQLLFTGIVKPERAAKIVEGLFGPDLFSGWGIRTVSSTEQRYNPMSYHNGSVWPHDNALIALGFARYGHKYASTRCSRACLKPRPTWICAAFRSCFADFSADVDEVQLSIRSPAHHRPGQVARRS